MIGRAALSAGALVVAAISVWSGLYQAHDDAAVATSDAPHGHLARAERDLITGDFRSAITHSRAAVGERPFNQTAVAALGAAYLANGDLAPAREAFNVSAPLGWRDPLTQRYWINQSLQLGAFAPAAQWLDALMRVAGGVDDTAQVALPILESTDGGRAALLTRLRQHPVWLDSWVRQSAQLDDTALNDRIAVIDAARQAGALPSRDALAAVTAILFTKQQRYRGALALWQAAETAGAVEKTGLWDDDFSRFAEDGNPSPFEWQLIQGSAVQTEIDSEGSAHQLSVSSDSATAQPIAVQTTLLTPGLVKLAWESTSGGNFSPPIFARVRCAKGPVLTPVADGHDARARWITVDIPASGCPAQQVEIWFDASNSGARSATVTRVYFE